ncbi:MAG: RNA polymerase sigma factor [Anaerolineales bacterium]|nr:RNA polymerase sigma factor [Anaerolineales bacterium]
MADPSGAATVLVDRLRRGDPEAWADACAQYGGPLFRYAYHLAGGESAWAEDIRQETLLAAASSIRRFRGESPFFGWLCAIARRKAADELRLRGRMADPPGEDDPAAGIWDRLESEPLPEEWVERAELRMRVVEALGNLPREYQRLLVSRYADGLAVEALARRMGRTYKATESMLSRAREALRRQLKEAGHG